MKIGAVEAKFLPVDRQTDGHTDITKLLLLLAIMRTRLKMIRNNTLSTVLGNNLATAKIAELSQPNSYIYKY
jgi:hypothetical protein